MKQICFHIQINRYVNKNDKNNNNPAILGKKFRLWCLYWRVFCNKVSKCNNEPSFTLIWSQVRNQDIFGEGEVSSKRSTLINVSFTKYKRRAPQGNILVFLLQGTYKTPF